MEQTEPRVILDDADEWLTLSRVEQTAASARTALTSRLRQAGITDADDLVETLEFTAEVRGALRAQAQRGEARAYYGHSVHASPEPAQVSPE